MKKKNLRVVPLKKGEREREKRSTTRSSIRNKDISILFSYSF